MKLQQHKRTEDWEHTFCLVACRLPSLWTRHGRPANQRAGSPNTLRKHRPASPTGGPGNPATGYRDDASRRQGVSTSSPPTSRASSPSLNRTSTRTAAAFICAFISGCFAPCVSTISGSASPVPPTPVMCSADIFLGLLAILFPPLPVWVKRGICSADSLINILLCCLGFIPGLFHAWYIIAKYPEPAFEYEALSGDREGGRVTYVYVQHRGPGCHENQQPHPQGAMDYGTRSEGQAQPPQQQNGVTASGGASSSNHGGVPPSYAEVVAGDHKVQSRD
ncbi:Plasma membrane proteolipid 3 [Tolypocladium capitatum]|uniref:Plasma membrane proteolipid 3 n=1 Tax=Tolypocladium capitatum TaxID=45235 RepID=A0A2K3QFK6_9HYPO|nr:Plasma membrane proteolipid 3 [Tolypocladium capitatum]